MHTTRYFIALPLLFLVTQRSTLAQWSIVDEVTLADSSLSADMAWEADFIPVCSQTPQLLQNLDFYSCKEIALDQNLRWIGYDAIGNRYGVMHRFIPGGGVWEIRRRVQGTRSDEVMATLTERRTDATSIRQQISATETWSIDQVNGWILLDVVGRCDTPYCPGPVIKVGVVRISGLPTLLDIVLSYQPPSTLSFNVPVHPEGLPGADTFSLYAGDVSTSADLSQATPMQCTVPVGRPPVPGEHLAVADPLPDPAPGDGRYYVAAVQHGAQVRAGRSSIGGTLQGRNAAALAGCK